MIDYLRCRIPLRLPGTVQDGCTVVFDGQGAEKFRTLHRLRLAGTFESALHVRAASTCELELEGNPAKWLQGHNLYGPDDLRSLLWATLERLLPLLDISAPGCGLHSPADLDGVVVTRVDCTEMFHLSGRAEALAWIRAAYATGRSNYRGRGVMRGDTLIFGDAKGKAFARWQVVIYAKGQEVEVHPLPELMAEDPEVAAWVDRCLRVEVRFGRLGLEAAGLRWLKGWTPEAAGQLWSAKLSKIEFYAPDYVKTEDVEALPVRVRVMYRAWCTGEDLRALLRKTAFYKYRKLLIDALGVDIALPPPSRVTAEVIPLKRVFNAVPVGRPPWADRIDEQLKAAGATIVR